MFTERRDYLLDMIQQLVQRIVEMLQKAQGQQVELAQLERDCERAMDDEFAELDRQMKGVEPRMVAHLVRPPERLRAYALLVAARTLLASRRAAAGSPTPTTKTDELEPQARRALCLVLEVTLIPHEAEPDRADPVPAVLVPAVLDAVRQLFPLVDDDRLSPRYLQALVALGPS